MSSTILRATGWILCAGTCLSAHAQSAPPIKPGLWQVTAQRVSNGTAVAPPNDRLASLPPEQRKQVEAAMKARGIDVSGGSGGGSGGGTKICLSKESLAQGHWQGRAGCKTDVKTRSDKAWAWHSSCSQPASETDGEATFTDAENYVVRTSTVMTLNGQSRTSQNTIAARWLGANCGELKPFTPPAGP